MKKFFENNKKGAKRIFALALAFIFSMSVIGSFVDDADIYAKADQSNTYYYVWHRCRTPEDIRKYMIKGSNSRGDSYEMFNHRLMMLYSNDDNWTNPSYILSGTRTDADNRSFYAKRINASDGINYAADTFTTINNFNTPFIKYAGKSASNKEAFMVRFMPDSSPISYDPNYEVATRNKEKAAGDTDAYYGRMTPKALGESKLYVYNCWRLWGGTQSATFFPKLVSKYSDELDAGGWWYEKSPARTAEFVFVDNSDDDDIKAGYMGVFTYRKWLLDASLTHDGDNLDFCYYDNDEEEWFMVYISTLEERPAICASATYDGYTTNFIASTTIKQGVTLTVTDNAVLKLSGEIVNLGMFVVKNGGTIIVDYDAVIKTDTTSVRQDGASPGTFRIESGGQLIILEGAQVSMPRNTKDYMVQTDDFNIMKGGTAFIAGTVYNGNKTNVDGQLYITKDGKIHQGYSPDLTQSVMTPTGKGMYINANTSLITIESDTAISCSMGVSWPANGDKEYYERYGGIYYGDLIFYEGDNINNYGTQLNETYTSGSNKYNLSSVITYTPSAIGDFCSGTLDKLINLYLTSGTGALNNKYIDDGELYDKLEDTPSFKALDSTSPLYADDLEKMKIALKCSTYVNSSTTRKIEGVESIELDCDGNEKTSGGGC